MHTMGKLIAMLKLVYHGTDAKVSLSYLETTYSFAPIQIYSIWKKN